MLCGWLQEYPIGEEKLIELAKKLQESGTGLRTTLCWRRTSGEASETRN
jgi:hypothetical protein